MPDVSKTTALVAHLPAGTGTCTLYEVDITRGWEAAKLCQQVRSWRTTKGLAAPFRVEQEPVTGLPDPVTGPDLHEPEGEESGRGIRDDGWADMVASATSKAELSKLWRAGTAQGWWTPVLTTLGKERLAELGS
jgi:hypothetical protein